MATFEKQLTDAVWYQCLLQYFIKKETENWGDLGQHQSEQSLACVMGFDSPTNEFYEFLNKKLEAYGISTLSLEEAEKEHQYFELKVGDEAFSVFESARINHALKSSQSDLILQVGYYGSEIEGILAKGYTESFNGVPIYILSKELIYTPNIIPGMVAVINNRQIYVREAALESIFEKKWVAHFDSVHYPEFSREETLSKEIRKQVMAHLGAPDREALLEQRKSFLTALKELIVYHEFGHAIIQYNVLDNTLATFSESATVLGDSIIIDLLELLADIVDEHDTMMGPLYFLLDTPKHSHKEKSAMFLTYLSDAWFYDTPNTFMYGYSDLITAVMVSLLGDGMTISPDDAKRYIKEDLYPWVKKEAEDLFNEFYSVVSRYPYFEDRKAYWDSESKTQHKGQGQYEKDVWAFSQVLIDLTQDDDIRGNLQHYLDEARGAFHSKFITKLGFSKKMSLRESVFERLEQLLSI